MNNSRNFNEEKYTDFDYDAPNFGKKESRKIVDSDENNNDVTGEIHMNFDDNTLLDNSKIDNLMNNSVLLANDLDNSKLLQQEEEYLTMSSNRIISRNEKQTGQKKNLKYFFTNDRIEITFFFDVKYFMLWNKEYFKVVYPSWNLIITFDINDDIESCEKISIEKKEESKDYAKFLPRFKRNDLKNKGYRFTKKIKKLNQNIDTPFKIRIQLALYSDNSIVKISEDELYLVPSINSELNKYQFYQNMNSISTGKKIGNLLFYFVYRIGSSLDGLGDPHISKQNDLLLGSIKNLSTFKEQTDLVFSYYNIDNSDINSNGKNVDFNSIRDITDSNYINLVEAVSELKNSKVSLERLLELFISSTKLYDLYDVLKKLNIFFSKTEFCEVHLEKFKIELTLKFESIVYHSEKYDKILITYILNFLKKVFFFQSKNNKKKEPHSKKYIEKESLLLLKNFKNTMVLIKKEGLDKEIVFGAVNYIAKNVEEPKNLSFDNKSVDGDKFFIEYLIYNEDHLFLLKCMKDYYSDSLCVWPVSGVINKLLKFRKDQITSIFNFLSKNNMLTIFKEILTFHCNNSQIIANLIGILYSISDNLDIVSLFYNRKK